MRSDWSKTHVLSEYKINVFRHILPLYNKANEEAYAVY